MTIPGARAAGEPLVFERVAAAVERPLLGLALRLTGRLEDAQDVAQEALTKLDRHLGRFGGEGEVWPWLRVVAVNLCRDVHRRRARSRLVFGVEREVEDRRDPESAASERQRADRLSAALARLGERERTALVLRELEGMETREVAEMMGTSEATVRVQIAQARLKLRALLKELS